MVNFSFIEGHTGTPLYWDTENTGSQIKDGPTLAKVITDTKAEMDAAAGPGKVRTVTTDKTKANKASWDLAKAAGLQGMPDAVHVHHSMVGDEIKMVAPLVRRARRPTR